MAGSCRPRRSRKVFAHCSGAKGLAVAVAAGVDAIEHGFFMDRDTLARMRDQGLVWTPTFCPVHFQWAHPELAVLHTPRRIWTAAAPATPTVRP